MATSNITITEAYPLELHYIKALCLQRQCRRCIQACRDISKTAGGRLEEHPVQQTFINFYLGLAHDELARLMHDCSQAKVPAFNQAGQFYKEALGSLPASSADLMPTMNVPEPVRDNDPFFDGASEASSAQTPEQDDEYDPFNYSHSSVPSSPPTRVCTDSLPMRSPPTSSRETSASDLNDLESHSSFDQIMTPHKILQRDISCMSLLDDLPKQPPGLPRTTSIMQGLLRPIRPGSPPKAFHVPPRLSYVSNVPIRNSKLPKLMTRNTQESPSRRQQMSMRETWEEDVPIAPVSPLGSEGAASDTSTISPVSPETPAHGSGIDAPSQTSIVRSADDAANRHQIAVNEHLTAMRAQLSSHLAMLEKAKQATLSAQAANRAERACATAPTTGTPLAPVPASIDGSVSRPSSSSSKHDSVVSGDGKRGRSYWPGVAESVKAEKQKRLEAGRKRGWARERFRAERYRELAERALAEL